MKRKSFYLFVSMLLLTGCAAMDNGKRPMNPDSKSSSYFTVSDGAKLFYYETEPANSINLLVIVVPGITGIDHRMQSVDMKPLIDAGVSVCILHPRGTGYSDGVRGDISDFSIFIRDVEEFIRFRMDSHPNSRIVLYGHSMSSAVALESALKFTNVIDGAILINPPFKMRELKGATPSLGDYLVYIGYMIFASHTPIVNMSGDPALIENPDDKLETAQRLSNELCVKYFSMSMMVGSKSVIDRLAVNSAKYTCPMLLIRGGKDGLMDPAGCDEIFAAWGSTNKQYLVIPDGPHGNKTAILAMPEILKWIQKIK